MSLTRSLLMTAGLFAAAAVGAETDEAVFFGYAFDADSGEYLYTERHRQRLQGRRWIEGSIDYFDAEGEKLGRKEMDFRANPYIPEYTLRLESGYAEGIRDVGEERAVMWKRSAGADSEETETLEIQESMAADSGFHSLIYDNLEAILNGETRKFRFAVAGNLADYSFRVRKIGETKFEGRPAALLKVEAATLLRLIAPSLQLTYDPENGQLLEYRGLSNVHDPATGKPFEDVRISYYSEPPEEATGVPEEAYE